MERTIAIMSRAAEAAGQHIRRYFGTEVRRVTKLNHSDYCTQADLASEREIVRRFKRQFPAYGIFSEEAGWVVPKREWNFIIDPLDGTNNFVMGIANFSVAIALERNDVTVAAVIHQPILKQTFTAIRGQGAWLGKQRLRVKRTRDIKRATVALMASYQTPRTRWIDAIRLLDLRLGVKRVVTHWSPAMDFCLLASGSVESIVSCSTQYYDVAAGMLIAVEAGAHATHHSAAGDNRQGTKSFIIACSLPLLRTLDRNVGRLLT